MKREKNRTHREYSRSGSPETFISYRDARNNYFIAVRKAQFDYESTKQQSLAKVAGTCPKKWWRLAKEMLGMSQTSQIPALLVDGVVINDDKEKAEAFNHTYLESSNLDDQVRNHLRYQK
jgi:histone acetyltransferase (RNA polymerase elongator complex component)